MSDETALDNQVRDSIEAQRILEHPLLIGAFKELEQTYLESALQLGADPKHDRARHRLLEGVTVLRSVRAHLGTVVDGGKVARAKLAELRGDVPKRFGII